MKPCHLGNAALFDDEARTDEARALCKRGCTQLIECRFWALHNDVAGVCGGMTERERASWRRDSGTPLPGWAGHLHDREALGRKPLPALSEYLLRAAS